MTIGENVFFADLHHPGGLDDEIDQLLNEIPSNTYRIFFLGDTFHFWINDDSFLQDRYSHFLQSLIGLSKQGIQLFFIEGNRDFLASHYLEEQPWIEVLANPTLVDIGDRAVYLGHGDELCWNDWAYQFYKFIIRSRPLRFIANHLPNQFRKRTANRMSELSHTLVRNKKTSTLEIPPHAYQSVLRSGIDMIVHGHVHQTYRREYIVNGRKCTILAFGWNDGKRNCIHFAG